MQHAKATNSLKPIMKINANYCLSTSKPPDNFFFLLFAVLLPMQNLQALSLPVLVFRREVIAKISLLAGTH
jgi:hypothetical protein